MLKLLRGDDNTTNSGKERGNEPDPTPSIVGANKRKTEIRNHISKTGTTIRQCVMSTMSKCPSIYDGTPKRLPYQQNYLDLIIIDYTMY
ncbi:hypothetical protein TcasGA2_TC031322 [Tribolium castaneum]|uniref:Uncharacterized protein n=1 Tax=Tribolium castaneum TaxID=7070 RepID=A0A139W8S0_TRICA|nr:hypothetical protein TcasGA2_TC031322 [Tribolium castaneum]